MPILANVTEAIGNTPLVRINRIIDAPDVTVAAKLEFSNGSKTPTSAAASWKQVRLPVRCADHAGAKPQPPGKRDTELLSSRPA